LCSVKKLDRPKRKSRKAQMEMLTGEAHAPWIVRKHKCPSQSRHQPEQEEKHDQPESLCKHEGWVPEKEKEEVTP
jgi:hypothetical protein